MKPSREMLLALLLLASCGGEETLYSYGGMGYGGYGEGGCSLDCWYGGNDPVGAGDTGGAAPEAPDCYDDAGALVFPDTAFSGVTIGQGVCDATQIAGALTECFAPGTVETCDAYNTANPECSTCIFGSMDDGIPIPVFLSGTEFTYLTLYACQAFASDLPACALPYQNLLFCANTACEGCDTAGLEKADCINYALNDPEVCGALPLDAACEVLFSAEDLPAECVGDPAATTFETVYPIIAEYYCGTAK